MNLQKFNCYRCNFQHIIFEKIKVRDTIFFQINGTTMFIFASKLLGYELVKGSHLLQALHNKLNWIYHNFITKLHAVVVAGP